MSRCEGNQFDMGRSTNGTMLSDKYDSVNKRMQGIDQRINEITHSRGVAKCPRNLLGNWLIMDVNMEMGCAAIKAHLRTACGPA